MTPPRAYYNEIDPFAAAWLRNLIAAGHIAPGDVDERSIVDVQPADLEGYEQCHFFAGIAGWSLALRMAGWADERHAWTGSCPCQPLSSAGQRKGHADERHLWPAFYGLIAQCRPSTVFGEQVAGKDGFEWLAGVRADLEDAGYACGAADLCAAGAGAPHLRQRLFWVADRQSERRGEAREHRGRSEEWSGRSGDARVADAAGDGRQQAGCERSGLCRSEGSGETDGPGDGGEASWLGHAPSTRRQRQRREHLACSAGNSRQPGPSMQNGVAQWNGATIAVQRADGWARIAAEPALFPVAARIPGDVGRLRGSGNAIVPQVAAQFVAAFMECRP